MRFELRLRDGCYLDILKGEERTLEKGKDGNQSMKERTQ
jgi:hypothetical protein